MNNLAKYIVGILIIGLLISIAISLNTILKNTIGRAPLDANSRVQTDGELCYTSSVDSISVGTTNVVVLAASSTRAYARIQLNGLKVVNLSFQPGVDAVSGEGFELSSSTPDIVFGLNTDFPYTGEVRALSETASSTVNVIECGFPASGTQS